ncbi:RING/U-box [Hesseltinella vesiculosa]|uniref:Anaphase-promoting complex subunit 11 n=1 Tax=Hesseltinella vesiculosa TaxID=101127 RepID=A0A1X2G7W5_9FUNG|nr:RING/U-box [Hesseltinella vesiculosa]
MKVRIKSWKMASYWRWDIDDDDDVCGICQNVYDSCCPNCLRPGDECPLLWGACNHVFHLHCITKWLETCPNNEHCPLDRKPWETAN